MREIKFRAWVPDANEMHTVDAIKFDGNDEVEEVEFGEACNWSEEDGGSGFSRHGKGCELMQYTGFKDKNGKEIYEGDVLIFDYPMKVFMSDLGVWAVRLKDGRESLLQGYVYEGEVIGNIWENPELIQS